MVRRSAYGCGCRCSSTVCCGGPACVVEDVATCFCEGIDEGVAAVCCVYALVAVTSLLTPVVSRVSRLDESTKCERVSVDLDVAERRWWWRWRCSAVVAGSRAATASGRRARREEEGVDVCLLCFVVGACVGGDVDGATLAGSRVAVEVVVAVVVTVVFVWVAAGWKEETAEGRGCEVGEGSVGI